MQLLASLVLAATAATSNGLAAPVANNPGATTSQGGIFAAVAAKNAEMLAVKEGKSRCIKSNCRGAIMASTPSTRRQFEGVAAWSLAVRFSQHVHPTH